MGKEKIKEEYPLSLKNKRETKKKKNEVKRKWFNNIISGLIKNLTNFQLPTGPHGMQSYLNSIISLETKISEPYGDRTSAISSCAEKLRISQELWNDLMSEKNSIQNNISYTNWINKYISIPGFSITIDKCFGTTTEEWIMKESKILVSIRQCEKDIIRLYKENNIDYNTKYTNSIDKELLLYHLSPLVLH